MNNLKNTFLGKLFIESKTLFLMLSVVVFLQLLCMLKNKNCFPFVAFDFYAEKIIPSENYPVYAIQLNKQVIDLFNYSEPQRNLILNSLSVFEMKQQLINHQTDSTKNNLYVAKKYPLWLLGMCGDLRLVDNPQMQVWKYNYNFKDKNALKNGIKILEFTND